MPASSTFDTQQEYSQTRIDVNSMYVLFSSANFVDFSFGRTLAYYSKGDDPF